MQSNRVVWNGRVPFAFAIALTALISVFAIAPAQAQPFDAAVKWMSLGPAGSQIGSGKLNAFAQVLSNPKIMYTGGGWGNTPRESPSQSGIYGTTDGGTTWKPLNDGLTNPDGTISSVVNGLWLDQANPSVVLAATEFGGTFRSTNGGSSWTNVDRSESTQFAQVGSKVYLASRRGILVSADDGATWSVSLASTAGATTVMTAGGATYAGTTSGDVYRLKSGTWTKTGHPGTGPVHNLAVDPFNKKIVYANVDDVSAWNEDLYGSIDGGHTWVFVNCNCSIGPQAIAFSQVVPDRIYMGDDGSGVIFYFTANGSSNPNMSFGAQPYGVDMRYIIPLPALVNTDDACMLLMDQGLFYAPRCTTGSAPPLNENVPNTLTYDVKVTPNGKAATVPLQDNSAANSTDGGKTWVYAGDANAGEGGESFIDPTNPAHCYFAHPDSGLWVSFDGCTSFNGSTTNSGVESLTFDRSTPNKMYAIDNADDGAAAPIVSTDGGNNWSSAPWTFADPYQVVISPNDSKTITMATGTATGVPHLYYTHNGGTNWHEAAGLPTQAQRNNTIYYPTHRYYVSFDANAPGTVLLSDHDPSTDNVLIYRSTDNAKTFALVRTFMQPVPPRPWPFLVFPNSHERTAKRIPYYATRFFANRLAFNPTPPTGKVPAVVLTTRFGAYVSYDVGSTWKRIDTKAIAHHFIGVDWNGGFVFLSSFGQGVIRSATPLQ